MLVRTSINMMMILMSSLSSSSLLLLSVVVVSGGSHERSDIFSHCFQCLNSLTEICNERCRVSQSQV